MSYTRNPTTGVTEIIEQSHYYPFGLKHTNYNSGNKKYYEEDIVQTIGMEAAAPAVLEAFGKKIIQTLPSDGVMYKYKFGGNEFQDELGLNVYDYDNRIYDQAIGRFWQMDPLAEQGRRWSPYNYCFDNPEASVKGNQVMFSSKVSKAGDNYWFGLISHEQSHRDDIDSGISSIDRKGYTKFYLNYLIQGASREYADIDTESKAFKFGSNDKGPDLADKLLAYKGGAVMDIFTRGNLTDNQKASMLEVVGNQFKRDVVLQGRIDYSEAVLDGMTDSNFSDETRAILTKMLNAVINNSKKEQNEITKKYGK